MFAYIRQTPGISSALRWQWKSKNMALSPAPSGAGEAVVTNDQCIRKKDCHTFKQRKYFVLILFNSFKMSLEKSNLSFINKKI